MESRRSFTVEMVADAQSMVVRRVPENALITSLRVRWNLTPESAGKLLQLAQSQSLASHATPDAAQSRTKQVAGASRGALWGVITLGGFMALTVVADIFAPPWIGSALTTILVGFVIWRYLRIFPSIPRRLGMRMSSDDTRSAPTFRGNDGYGLSAKGSSRSWNLLEFLRAYRTALISVVAIVALFLIGIGIVIANSTPVPGPSDGALVWAEEEVREVETGKLRFEGRIRNDDPEWAISDPEVVTTFFSGSGLLITERRTDLILDYVSPGQSRFYSFDVTVFEKFDTYESELEWKWTR